MKHECEIWSCENMEYLGHFNNPEFLKAGHNSEFDADDYIPSLGMTQRELTPERYGGFVPSSEGEGLVRSPKERTYSESELTQERPRITPGTSDSMNFRPRWVPGTRDNISGAQPKITDQDI